MKITLLQFDTVWNDRAANIRKAESLIRQSAGSDLLILPETFNSGFAPAETGMCDDCAGQTVEWMYETSGKRGAAICTSLFERVGNAVYNRLYFITPGGSKQIYDKRHLFMGDEKEHITAGTTRVVTDFMGWRILLQICYDLRFPVWARNRGDYDLAVYVANWPEARGEVWKTLLKARAIENQCYVAGVNRIGTDSKGVSYAGESLVIDPYGREILSLGCFTESHGTVELSLERLMQFRQDFPVLPDGDEFTLIV